MPIAHFLICDDIRTEIGNKKTFIGVYPNKAIKVASFPYRYPILAFFFEIQETQGIRKIEINITPPNSKTNHLEMNIERPAPKIFVEARLENFVIPEAGIINVEIIGNYQNEISPWNHKISIPVAEMKKPTQN